VESDAGSTAVTGELKWKRTLKRSVSHAGRQRVASRGLTQSSLGLWRPPSSPLGLAAGVSWWISVGERRLQGIWSCCAAALNS
jgi:hypothetical protein